MSEGYIERVGESEMLTGSQPDSVLCQKSAALKRKQFWDLGG
jgi:hypothetical protein